MYKFIDVCSEQEAIELIQELGLNEPIIFVTSYGYRVRFKEIAKESKFNNPNLAIEEYVVTCLHPYTNSRMYLSKKGVTFNIEEAIRLSKHKANTKAKYAKKNSKMGYMWEAIRIK